MSRHSFFYDNSVGGDFMRHTLFSRYRYDKMYRGLWRPPITCSFFGDSVYKNVINDSYYLLDEQCPYAKLPLVLGYNDTDGLVMFDLLKLRHILVTGSQGGGKTVGLLSFITSMIYFARPDSFDLWVFDYKGDMDCLRQHSYYARSDAEMRHQIKMLSLRYEAVKKVRIDSKLGNVMTYNASQGMYGAHIKYNVIVCDEFFILKKNFENIEDFVLDKTAIGRADGFFFIVALQRPDFEAISTKIRQNITSCISFYQRSDEEYKMAGVVCKDKITKQGEFIFNSSMLDNKKYQIPYFTHEQASYFLDNLSRYTLGGNMTL